LNIDNCVEGTELVTKQGTFDAKYVQDYIAAIGESSAVYSNGHAVPPLAVVAWLLKSVIGSLDLPPGTVHSGQEIECVEMVQIGDTVTSHVEVEQNTQRSQWRFLTLGFFVNKNVDTVIKGKISLLIPAE
tara:strand:- start:82 stop:471 length:390 start_codon:yes stop_codon:yes gene_type:complete